MSEPTSSPPISKRRRTDDRKKTESDDIGNGIRSTIWFEDGNIIVQADKTQFRVHKSLLSRHSNFFKDMFSVPQPENEPTVQGCAIVYVADEAVDWRIMFEILYDNVRVYTSTKDISFPQMQAMLRIGKKYQFDDIQAVAMGLLRSALPQTLDAWDKAYAKGCEWKPRNPNIFALINLLLELRIRSLLPVAYYVCLEYYSLEAILVGKYCGSASSADLSPQTKRSLILGQD